MIEVRLTKEDNFVVEIIPGNWEPEKWKPLLEKLAASNKAPIFRINTIDDSGLTMVVLRYWLERSKKLKITTQHDWIEEIISIALEDDVTFV